VSIFKVIRRIIALCLFFPPIGNASENKQITEEYFCITLPVTWRQTSKPPEYYPAYYQYLSKDKNESLSVSIFPFKSKIAESEQLQMLDEFLDTRIQVEKKIPNSSTLKISSIVKQKQKNAHVALYTGYQPETNRRFRSFIIADNSLIAVFYYEALDMSEKLFTPKMQKIIGRVSLKS